MKFECAYDEKLVSNPRNPNKHPDRQVERPTLLRRNLVEVGKIHRQRG